MRDLGNGGAGCRACGGVSVRRLLGALTATQPPGGAGIDATRAIRRRPSTLGRRAGPLRVDPVNPRYFTAARGASTSPARIPGATSRTARTPIRRRRSTTTASSTSSSRTTTTSSGCGPGSSRTAPTTIRSPLYFTPLAWPRPGPALASDGKPQFDLDQFDQAYFDRLRAGSIAAQRPRHLRRRSCCSTAGTWPTATTQRPADSRWRPATTQWRRRDARQSRCRCRNAGDHRAPGSLRPQGDRHRQRPRQRALRDRQRDRRQRRHAGLAVPHDRLRPRGRAGQAEAAPGGHDLDLYPGDDRTRSVRQQRRLDLAERALVASDGSKVILNDTDHSYGWTPLQSDGPAAQRAWAWKTLCIGAPPLFMDPYLETWAGRNSPTARASIRSGT